MNLCSEGPGGLAALVAGFGAHVPIVAPDGQEVGAAINAQLLHGTVADVVTIEIQSAELRSGAWLVPVYVGARLARLEVVGPLAGRDPFANAPRGMSGARWMRAAARRYASNTGAA
jgi:hypothetical protein